MAVDTRNKRFSLFGLGLDALRVRPNPDGVISNGPDRIQWLPLYRGIADVTAAPTSPGLEYTLPRNRLHATMPTNRLHATMPRNRLHYTMPKG